MLLWPDEKSVLLKKCHLQLSHSWPPRNKCKIKCTSFCVCVCVFVSVCIEACECVCVIDWDPLRMCLLKLIMHGELLHSALSDVRRSSSGHWNCGLWPVAFLSLSLSSSGLSTHSWLSPLAPKVPPLLSSALLSCPWVYLSSPLSNFYSHPFH